MTASVCTNVLVTPDLSQIYKEKYFNRPRPMVRVDDPPPIPASSKLPFLAPALISRPPVARRPVPRHPRRSALFYGSSHPVSTHSSYLDSISIARPDIRSRSRSRWTGYPPAVLLYSFVQDLQHEYDGVDCQKDYFKLPCAPFYDTYAPSSIDDRLHIEHYIPFTIDCDYRLVRISLQPLERTCFPPRGRLQRSHSFQEFSVYKWRSLT